MNWFKKPLLGVDLGSRTVKGVQLKKEKGGRVSLTGHFFQDLAKVSEDFPSRVNRDESLRAALEVQRLGSCPAAGAILDSEVLTFTLELPKMNEKELAKVVPQEVAELAGVVLEEHSIDFVIPQTQPENPEAMSVRAFCVKRETVVKQMKFLSEAALKPAAIETEMMAVSSMLEFNGYLDPKEVVMVIDLGESHITSALISDGVVALTRNHEASIGSVNQALKNQYNLGYEAAESAKVEYDFLSAQEDNPVSRVMDEVFTGIFKSVKDAVEFYRECPESFGRIDRIFLIGGGSQIKGIDKIHQMIFKIPTTVVNPFRNIDIFTNLDQNEHDEVVRLAPFMAAAVGLALGSIQDPGAA